jgi:homoserine kinase type II
MLRKGAQLISHLTPTGSSCCKRHWMKSSERKAQILALPRANLHADLFRDNAMFEGTHLTGLIDFYNACSGRCCTTWPLP